MLMVARQPTWPALGLYVSCNVLYMYIHVASINNYVLVLQSLYVVTAR